MAPKRKAKGKKPMGRPSLYRPEYCKSLLEHMSGGFSIESFAAIVGVHRDTIYEWKKTKPDFSDTIRKGEVLSLLFWEKMGHAGMTGKIKGFSAAIYCFNMKNRFGWRDIAPAPVVAIEDGLADALSDLDELEAAEKKRDSSK